MELVGRMGRLMMILEERAPAGSPADGDVELRLDVTSSGFNGSASGWVERDALERFLVELEAVETSRQGTADLASLPVGFELCLSSVDRVGHFAAEGRIEKLMFDDVGQYDLAMNFGFEFDPSALQDAINEVSDWLGGRP